MSWSLRAVTGGKSTETSRPRLKKYDPKYRNWWERIPSSALGKPPLYGAYLGYGSPRRRTLSDNMLGGPATGRPLKSKIADIKKIERRSKTAYQEARTAIQDARDAYGLIRAGIRSIRGNDEGYKLEYSEKGGQVFVETFRSYQLARRAEEKLRKKGWTARIIPVPKKRFSSTTVNLGHGITKSVTGD
jgi:hypothetical protein